MLRTYLVDYSFQEERRLSPQAGEEGVTSSCILTCNCCQEFVMIPVRQSWYSSIMYALPCGGGSCLEKYKCICNLSSSVQSGTSNNSKFEFAYRRVGCCDFVGREEVR